MGQEEKHAPGEAPSEAPGEVTAAIYSERVMSLRDTLRFWPKAIVFSLVISLTVIMEVT